MKKIGQSKSIWHAQNIHRSEAIYFNHLVAFLSETRVARLSELFPHVSGQHIIISLSLVHLPFLPPSGTRITQFIRFASSNYKAAAN